jgi:hypothetical protein
MSWQLRDPLFQQAIGELVDRLGGRCAIAGAAGVQIHLAHAIGLDKLGPPAHAIEVVVLGDVRVPDLVAGVPVARAEAFGFKPSIEARTAQVEIGGRSFPVAAPEHVLGLSLAASELLPDAKWACFVLMLNLGEQLDLEEVRGILKRSEAPDRQSLLAELAYLAA